MSEQRFLEKIEVESYSGYKANERPLSFWLRERNLRVLEVVDRWYGDEDDFFKVLADDRRVYLLKWQRLTDEWSVVNVVRE